MFFLWYLLIGLVAGWLANLIVKGRGSGLIVNLVVGIVGGVLGGWIFSLFGLNHRQYRHFGSRCYRIVVDRSCRRQ